MPPNQSRGCTLTPTGPAVVLAGKQHHGVLLLLTAEIGNTKLETQQTTTLPSTIPQT